MWVNLAILVSISLKTVFVVSHFHLQNGVPDKVCCQQSFHGNTIMSTSASCEFRTVRVGNTNFTVDKCYSNLKEIGSGAYGVVAKAVDSRTGRKVAIKKVKHVFCNVEDATRILRELKLLSHFKDHENVVQLLDVMAYPPNTEKFQDIYIVTNFMDKNLGRVVDSAKQKLSDQHLQYFLYQILRGLKYVHSANVLHRDLKPENIVINVNCDLALCDFGLSRGYDDKVHHLTEYVVTRHYRPPELLLECAMYGKPVDVWSVGCIFAELILRRPMFCGETPQHQLRLIVEKLGMLIITILLHIPVYCSKFIILHFLTVKFVSFLVPQQACQRKKSLLLWTRVRPSRNSAAFLSPPRRLLLPLIFPLEPIPRR